MENLIFASVVSGDLESTLMYVQQALEENQDPQMIINDCLIAAMEEVGRNFENGKAFIPNLLMSARAMKGALNLLLPYLKGHMESKGTVVIGTVKGDLHDIGKNLVASMLEGCGFKVINLGVNVDEDGFVSAVKEYKPQILCMSALLTTTMVNMKNVIDALVNAGLRDKVKIMIGGAPVTMGFANEIGADGYSDNANAAVACARKLLFG